MWWVRTISRYSHRLGTVIWSWMVHNGHDSPFPETNTSPGNGDYAQGDEVEHIAEILVERALERLIAEGMDPESLAPEVIEERLGDEIAAYRSEYLDSFLATAPDKLQRLRVEREAFYSRLVDIWGEALDLLDLCLILATQIGAEINEEGRAKAAAASDFQFDALLRLHARSCQVGQEILWLLKGGFSTAAQARWRTLYELTVVARFLSEGDSDLSERFLLHDGVTSYRALQRLQDHYKRLGYDPPTPEELGEVSALRAGLIARFGEDYKGWYGWAAVALGKRNPMFSDIEKAVKLDHWRPYYLLSSHGVHAGPKGLFFSFEQGAEQRILLTGPSDRGLDDPGQCAAISISQVTACLLSMNVPITVPQLAAIGALEALADRAVSAFTSHLHSSKCDEIDMPFP